MYKVYVGSPSYDGRIQQRTMSALLQAVVDPDIQAQIMTVDCSSLTRSFNTLWLSALNARAEGFTRFLMIHDDVAPASQGWLKKMLSLMDHHKADVISAVIAQKRPQGFTSTAWDLPEGIQSIPLKRIFKMEPTFTDPLLLVNTGLMLVDMSKPWVEKMDFKFESGIENGKVIEVSEDWNFSRRAKALGAVLYATRAVKVYHVGRMLYPNDHPWGTEE